MGLGQGPAVKRRDSTGAQGRLVCHSGTLFFFFNFLCSLVLTFPRDNENLIYLFDCFRLRSRVVTTRTSQDRNRPSSRLDSEGEEDDDDADKVSQ